MSYSFGPPNPPVEPPYSYSYQPAPDPYRGYAPTAPQPQQPPSPSGGARKALLLGAAACVLAAVAAVVVTKATEDSSSKQASPPATAPATTVAASTATTAGGANDPVITAPANPSIAPSGQGLDVGSIVAKISPSVVKVAVDISSADGSGEGVGTGIILTADGQIITNAHVVSDATKVRVLLSGKSEPVDATVVGIDVGHDLALIKIDAKNLPVMTIADSSKVKVGDPVVAMGYALDLEGDPSVTSGIISALNRSMVTDSGALNGLLQTDAAISSGNSGGPLVNASGELIGINTAVARGDSTNTATNIGFAIATQEIQKILSELRAGQGVGSVDTRVDGYLGIGVSDRTDGGRGAIVSQVQDGSPAAQLGLQDGDVVTSVNGEEIDGQGGLIAAIRGSAPGDTVTIDYERNGQAMTGKVTLVARPAS
ncbi:MAG TPA: trypsin-like peptidase domain-containing protein [Ilumatobacteraceae bacterium]|jgi:putative serine protease PepD